jgi:hypothetical protein
LRLTFVFLTWFSISAAVAATPWVAHYVPVDPPDSVNAIGAAQALAVDSSGNAFVATGGALSGENQTCVFKLGPQRNQLGQVCFANSGSVAAARRQSLLRRERADRRHRSFGASFGA